MPPLFHSPINLKIAHFPTMRYEFKKGHLAQHYNNSLPHCLCPLWNIDLIYFNIYNQNNLSPVEISTETGAKAPNFMILVRIRNTDGRKLNLDLIPSNSEGYEE